MRNRRRKDPVLAAHQHRSATILMSIIVLLMAAAWAAHHAIVAFEFDEGTASRLTIVWIVLFLVFILQTLMYHLERPRKLTARNARQLNSLHVAIIVPAYNEDPGYLRAMLESFLRQTRLPDSVHVVDDGSKNTDYAEVRTWWEPTARTAGVRSTWQRVENGGKRHAQAHAVRVSPDADIYITCDSDSIFAPNAVEQVVIPFARPRVQSVAGIVVAANVQGPPRPERPTELSAGREPDVMTPRRRRKRALRRLHRQQIRSWRSSAFLLRVTDLWFVTCQLVDRSGQSAIGAVMVNSGPLAAYRAGVIRDNLGSYLNETFMGRPVMFSDDSLLTLYAQQRGLTVQQPSAICFSAMPEKWSHFSRMYLRWMRGSTIRSIWRARYLPVHRPAYWLHALRWLQMILTQMVTVWLLLVEPVYYGNLPPYTMLVIPFLIAYAQGLRYLGIIRSDVRIRFQFATWLMMPLAVMLAWTHLRFLRWYGIFTCAKTGWGTRQNGAEVSLGGTQPSDAAPVAKLLDPDTETTLTTDTVPLRVVQRG